MLDEYKMHIVNIPIYSCKKELKKEIKERKNDRSKTVACLFDYLSIVLPPHLYDLTHLIESRP